MEFAKCVCMGSCDVLALYFRLPGEQIINIEEEVLYISLIFQLQILLFIPYSLNVDVLLYNIIQPFILVLLLLSQHKGYNVIKGAVAHGNHFFFKPA